MRMSQRLLDERIATEINALSQTVLPKTRPQSVRDKRHVQLCGAKAVVNGAGAAPERVAVECRCIQPWRRRSQAAMRAIA